MARLPSPGGDTGNWGDLLNEFLSVAHNPDGTEKSGIFDPKSFGAKADLQVLLFGSMGPGSSSNVLTCSTKGFTPGDKGKTITVTGVGSQINIDGNGNPYGKPMTGKVSEYISDSQIKVDFTASTQRSDSAIIMATDDTAALNAVWTAAKNTRKGGTIKLSGWYGCRNLNWTGGNWITVEGDGSTFLMPFGDVTGNWIDFGNNGACTLRRLRLGEGAYMQATADVGLFVMHGGNETTALKFEDLMIRGKFLNSTMYTGGGTSLFNFKNVKFYNDHNGGYSITITSTNIDNLRSTNYSTVPGDPGQRQHHGASDYKFTEASEFHEQATPAGTRSRSYPIRLDCVERATFQGFHSATMNYNVLVTDAIPSSPTRELAFRECVFAGDDPKAYGALLLNSPSILTNVIFELCYFQTAGPNYHIISSGPGGGNTAGFDGLVVRNCRNIVHYVNPNDPSTRDTTTSLLALYSSSNTNRLTNSHLEAMGLSVTVSGGTDQATEILNTSGVSAGSGGGQIKARIYN